MRSRVCGLCWILGLLLGLGFAVAAGQEGGGKPGEEKPGAEDPAGDGPQEAPGDGAKKDGDAAARERPTRNDWARSALTANRVSIKARRREGGTGTDKPARSAP